MAQLISEIWEGLRSAGLPEVMLYLPDQSASRCHWKDTALIGDVRVALLADQDRQIVRILPVDSCVGIGIASPKGVDPSGYKTTVYKKLRERFGAGDEADSAVEEPVPEGPPHAAAAPPIEPSPPPAPAPAPTPTEPPPPEPAVKADPTASRWGMATRAAPRQGAGQGTSTSGSFIPLRKF